MGANPTQAVGVTVFLLAFTALAGGNSRRKYSSVPGCRSLSGRIAGNISKKSSRSNKRRIEEKRAMILVGILLTLLGFVISVLSLGVTSSVGGRLAMVLVGLAVSLFGIMGVLNKAYLKNAIWKKG